MREIAWIGYYTLFMFLRLPSFFSAVVSAGVYMTMTPAEPWEFIPGVVAAMWFVFDMVKPDLFRRRHGPVIWLIGFGLAVMSLLAVTSALSNGRAALQDRQAKAETRLLEISAELSDEPTGTAKELKDVADGLLTAAHAEGRWNPETGEYRSWGPKTQGLVEDHGKAIAALTAHRETLRDEARSIRESGALKPDAFAIILTELINLIDGVSIEVMGVTFGWAFLAALVAEAAGIAFPLLQGERRRVDAQTEDTKDLPEQVTDLCAVRRLRIEHPEWSQAQIAAEMTRRGAPMSQATVSRRLKQAH